MKKLVCLTLCVLILITSFSFASSAEDDIITVTPTGVNTSRSENALIIYTPDFGTTTNTNQWGTEAVVDKTGKVIRVTTSGNETIPEDGFVISGHGTNSDWVRDNAKKDMYASYRPYSNTLILSSDPVITQDLSYTMTHSYNSINGTRGENHIVIYTNSGRKTATNDWGYEVTVVDGRVTAMGGNNTLVPENGYVVSGHGTSLEWLQDNVKMGMAVTYDTTAKTITFSMDDNSYMLFMNSEIASAKEAIEKAKASYIFGDYDAAENAVKKCEEYASAFASATEMAEKYSSFNAFNGTIAEASLFCSESRPVETRGCWIRPVETTRKQVASKVQQLYDAGINTICIETNYNGMLICPAPEGSLCEQNPLFRGFDVLDAYIKECHSRGMELHLWMPIFYWGHTNGTDLARSPWYKKPEWRNISNLGYDHIVNSDDTFCFLNPAHPEVRAFLLDLYRYLLTTYEIDGFELDYIRYRTRDSEDYGYDDITIKGWQEATGQTVTPKNDTSADYWESWVQYRCDMVNSFVGEVRKLFDEVSPTTLLCADVVTNPKEAKETVYQDYTVWLDNGWIDLLKPMSYYDSAIACLPDVLGYAKGAFVSAGLGAFEAALTPEHLLVHEKASVAYGCDGVTFFESNAVISKNLGSFFGKGPFRNAAVTPSYDTLQNAVTMLEYAKQRMDEVIAPCGGMTNDQRAAIVSEIDKIIGDIEKLSPEEAAEKIKAIKVVCTDEKASSVIFSDLDYVVRILTRLPFIKHTEYVEETSEELSSSDEESSTEEKSAGEESAIPEESSVASDVSEAKESGSRTGIIIAVAAAIAVIAVAAVIVIKKRKG